MKSVISNRVRVPLALPVLVVTIVALSIVALATSPALACGGAVSTVSVVPLCSQPIAVQSFAVPSVATFVPTQTVIAVPQVVQQKVIVQQPRRQRSSTVIRIRSR